jgi:hypothetical protein
MPNPPVSRLREWLALILGRNFHSREPIKVWHVNSGGGFHKLILGPPQNGHVASGGMKMQSGVTLQRCAVIDHSSAQERSNGCEKCDFVRGITRHGNGEGKTRA